MRIRGIAHLFETRSIAARLLASAAFWSIAILLVAGIALSALYRSTAETEFDRRLGVYLSALLADVATRGDESRTAPGQLGEPQFENQLSGWYWQITRLDGNSGEIKSSRSLFASRLPRLSEQHIQADFGGARQGYVLGPDKRTLRMVERVINIDDGGIFLVQVAAGNEDIEDQIDAFQLSLAVTFVLLAAALVASSAFQVRFGLEPLRRLQHGVAGIRRGETDGIAGDFPPDIAPLASELNLLIESNRAIVERARTQVGNLAHALKTPLSVITNESDEDPGQFARKVREQAAVMRDQVTYYLDRARMAARAGSFGLAMEVRPALDALVRTFGKIYCDQTVSFDPGALEAVRFAGEKQDFEEMVGNLVDNACKWAGGAVRIALEPGAPADSRPHFFLLVEDDGPGLPETSREAAMRRGKRLDESKPGSGLGLSIVVDLAELYGGALLLEESPLGGLRARLRLPMV